MTRCGLQEWVWLIGGGVVNMRGVANMRRGYSLYTVDVIEEGVTNRGANLNGEDNQICLLGDYLFISTLTTWRRGGGSGRGGRRGGENVERPI